VAVIFHHFRQPPNEAAVVGLLRFRVPNRWRKAMKRLQAGTAAELDALVAAQSPATFARADCFRCRSVPCN
jgi:hypothetical protein